MKEQPNSLRSLGGKKVNTERTMEEVHVKVQQHSEQSDPQRMCGHRAAGSGAQRVGLSQSTG